MVIIFNIFAYGRDLVIFPKMRRVSERERYPGSPDYDEYSEDDSDSDDSYNDDDGGDDYNEARNRQINPRKVARYVNSHIRN